MARKAEERAMYIVCPPGELDIGILPGTETQVFETDLGRVGLCICFDLN